MELPLQITFHGMPPSDAIASAIRDRVAGLERHFEAVLRCRVIVDLPHRHHEHGNHYAVRVEVIVPGGHLVASREPDGHHAYTDVYIAIRDAFDAMERQLGALRERRGERSVPS